MTTTDRSEILAILSRHDDGTGTLGIIIDQYLADHPEAASRPVRDVARDIAEIVVEAVEDERVERARR